MTLSESCKFFSLLQLEALQTVNSRLYILYHGDFYEFANLNNYVIQIILKEKIVIKSYTHPGCHLRFNWSN